MTKLTVTFRNFSNTPKNEGVNRAVISCIKNWGILLPSCKSVREIKVKKELILDFRTLIHVLQEDSALPHCRHVKVFMKGKKHACQKHTLNRIFF
jgi:hypothetical protein